MLIQILLILHVLAAMVWFGGSMFIPRRARAALQADVASARVQLQALAREGRMLSGAAFLTFIAGVSLLLARGGFGAHPPRFHVSLLLSFIWVIIGAVFARRALANLVAATEGDRIAEDADTHARKLGMFTGIQHALFTITTVLMLWRM